MPRTHVSDQALLDEVDRTERALRIAYAGWIRGLELYRSVRHRELDDYQLQRRGVIEGRGIMGDRDDIAGVIREIRIINGKIRRLRAILASIDKLRAQRDPHEEPFGENDVTP